MKRTRSIACNDSHTPASSNNSRSDRAKQPFRDQQFQARDSCIVYRTTSNIREFLERITRFIDSNFPIVEYVDRIHVSRHFDTQLV